MLRLKYGIFFILFHRTRHVDRSKIWIIIYAKADKPGTQEGESESIWYRHLDKPRKDTVLLPWKHNGASAALGCKQTFINKDMIGNMPHIICSFAFAQQSVQDAIAGARHVFFIFSTVLESFSLCSRIEVIQATRTSCWDTHWISQADGLLLSSFACMNFVFSTQV